MKLEKMIKELILAGKSDEEIAAAITKCEDAMKLTTEALADLIAKVQGEAQAEAADQANADKLALQLRSAKSAKESDVKIKAAVKAEVDETLKSLKVNPLGGFGAGGSDLKQFDIRQGKMVDVKAPSEMYAHANDMIAAILTGDVSTAKGISKEIEQENVKSRAAKLSKMGVKATPTVSDVVARGGYAIPTEVDDMITQMIYADSVMLQNANKDTIIVNDKIYPVMYGMDVGYIADQSTAATEKNPTFYNPTVSMKRVGGFSAIANKIIQQKGADLVNAFMLAYKSSFARFLDLHMAVGCVTGNSDLQDGLTFDPLTVLDTPVALAALKMSDLTGMTAAISQEAEKLVWIGNRKVRQTAGLLESTNGFPLFPQFVGGGNFAPLGIPFIENVKIPSVLNVAGDVRTAGTSDVLLLADMSKVAVGIDGETRIDISTDFLFTSDATTLRGIRSVGWKVLLGNTQATGGVVRALELTN